MTRLATAFAKPHPALVAFITAGDGPAVAILSKLAGRGKKDICTAAEALGERV